MSLVTFDLMVKSKNREDTLINIFDKLEVIFWCERLKCEKEDLINAALTSGRSVKEIKEHLKYGPSKVELESREKTKRR